MKDRDILGLIDEITLKLKSDKENTRLLHQRAQLFTKLQNHSSAINDYLSVLAINPADKIAKVKLDMLKTIVKYSNTDIYASPNTNMDPWME